MPKKEPAGQKEATNSLELLLHDPSTPFWQEAARVGERQAVHIKIWATKAITFRHWAL